MANPKLPAHWRRNALQPGAEYYGPPAPPHLEQSDLEYLHNMVPGIRQALERGWEIIAYISTDTKANGWGQHFTKFVLDFYANGMLLKSMRFDRIEDPTNLVEAIAKTVPSLFVVIGQGERPQVDFGLTSASDLLGFDPPPREWHVPGVIPAGLPTLFFGDGGTGKSLASLQLGVATVAGRSWLSHDVRRGPCIYMSAEDDEDEVHRRLDDILRHEDVPSTAVRDLQINAKVGEDALLGIYNPDTRMIEPTALYGALERAVERNTPALLILDTLADVFGGDENVRGQARQFIGLLRRLNAICGTAIVCLAHPSVAGLQSGTGTSGSTGWSNSVRSRLYLERVFEMRGKGDARRLVEPDPDVRLLTTKKINHGRVGGNQRLRWTDGVLQVEAAPLLLTGSSKVAEVIEETGASVDELFLTLIAAYTSEGRNVGASPSSSYAPSLFAKDERSGRVTKAAFVKAMSRLIADKRIVIEPYGPPSRGTKRLVLVTETLADPPADAGAD